MTKMKEKIMEIMGESYDDALFERAVTHSSKGTCNNERLEFLGNAILNMHLATIVHSIKPEIEPEEMTLICNNARSNDNLNQIGRSNSLDDLIITGLSAQGRVEDDMVSTAFEALIGMVFFTSGLDATTRFIDEFIPMCGKDIERYEKMNPITELKEFRDKHGGSWIIEETTEIKNDGPNKFHHSITYDGKSAKGSGTKKNEARKIASKNMLELLGK